MVKLGIIEVGVCLLEEWSGGALGMEVVLELEITAQYLGSQMTVY